MPVFKQDESKFKMKSGNSPAFKMMGKESAFPLIRLGISKRIRKAFGSTGGKKGYFTIDRNSIDLSKVTDLFKRKRKNKSKKSTSNKSGTNSSSSAHVMHKPNNSVNKKPYVPQTISRKSINTDIKPALTKKKYY